MIMESLNFEVSGKKYIYFLANWKYSKSQSMPVIVITLGPEQKLHRIDIHVRKARIESQWEAISIGR